MSDEKKKCKACKELIWSDASICPHCRTEQVKHFHKTILVMLKELSAITVIFSLIFAVMELSRFADSWFEDSAYADRLADSALIVLGAGDFSGARNILLDAKKIYPASESVNAVRQQLAMISIRKSGNPNTPEKVKVLKESLYALYHNLGKSDKGDAEILAHIAWASYRLGDNGYYSVDISQYLDKALILDGASIYANAYKGYLYLSSSWKRKKNNDNLTGPELVSKAQQHFNIALSQNEDLNYVRGLQLSALKSRVDLAGTSEYVKIILLMDANNDEFITKHHKKITNDLKRKLYDAFERDDKMIMDNVFLSLSVSEIKVIKRLLDFIPNKKHELSAGQGYALSYSAVLTASISKKEGDYLRAIKEYIGAYNIVKSTMSGFRYRIPKALKVICTTPEVITPESKALCDEFFESTLNPRHFS